METIYAIYKENMIPLVGGVNPDGIEIGMAEYKGWKLCMMKESEFSQFSEFRMYPVSKAIAVGLMLRHKGNKMEMPSDEMDDDIPDDVLSEIVSLTPDEVQVRDMAKDYIKTLELKFITRVKVRQFKDFEDDLSDTKLLVEFLLGYISEDYSSKTESEKAEYPIKDLMDSFVLSLEGKDLRINNDKILGKVAQIIKDESFIARIVKSNYVDKLKG